ncbi:hypothetical protein [Enterovibrio norvegicus]|uniref:Uncharacterized protein n=1 Tax=Enterovibrio norvegicus TaxID=188144 RepID=A0A2N7LG78_9GAMM|nr:hypothetical protein [Enterovibrio norvegicus]PML81981.1 hypothetical protein BCT69_01170 [Enterovibrio norvegicus]PMN74007.1 hypothetical protein BCT27_00045 [Enterovibrio norvegicus]PMN94486.1 hypothetical protein BCT23_09935 [Enterovibrio norvegicus]
MSNFEVLLDFVKENKKIVIPILLIVLTVAGLYAYRLPDFIYGWKVQYDLKKETEVRLLTGQCVVNVSKSEDQAPDWIHCERLFGTTASEGGVDLPE